MTRVREQARNAVAEALMMGLAAAATRGRRAADAASDVWEAKFRELLRHDPYKVGTTLGCKSCSVAWPCSDRQRIIEEALGDV